MAVAEGFDPIIIIILIFIFESTWDRKVKAGKLGWPPLLRDLDIVLRSLCVCFL